jgi:hypothetical protein
VSDDPVLDAVARLIEREGWTGIPELGVIVYLWTDDDGEGVLGWALSEGARYATVVGLLEWAKTHVLGEMIEQPEKE